jgi:hypothetical protein
MSGKDHSGSNLDLHTFKNHNEAFEALGGFRGVYSRHVDIVLDIEEGEGKGLKWKKHAVSSLVHFFHSHLCFVACHYFLFRIWGTELSQTMPEFMQLHITASTCLSQI